MRDRLWEDDAKKVYGKLGTMATSWYIHKDDYPPEEGDIVRWTGKANGWISPGKVEKVEECDGEIGHIRMSRGGSWSAIQE